MLREAAFDPKFAATVSLVCKRWRALLNSDGFYRSIELLAVTRRTNVLPGSLPELERLLARPQYRNVCDISMRGITLSTPLLRAVTCAFSALSCISFCGCSQLSAQPLLETLPSLLSLRALDFSSSSSNSRDSSPLAPKWLALILQAAPALMSLDVQSCPEFTTESLKNLARVARSSLTLLNISYTSATLDSQSLFRLLVRNTPEMREFYCCGLSLPSRTHGHHPGSTERWAQLRTLSAACQKNYFCQSPQVLVVVCSQVSSLTLLVHLRQLRRQLVDDRALLRLLDCSRLLLHLDLGCACVCTWTEFIQPTDVSRLQVRARFHAFRCGPWLFAA